MKETAKPFKTYYAQLKLLRKRGLEVPTDGKPMRALERIGYYTLINGYKTLFLTRDTNGNIIILKFSLTTLVLMKSYHYIILTENLEQYYIPLYLNMRQI